MFSIHVKNSIEPDGTYLCNDADLSHMTEGDEARHALFTEAEAVAAISYILKNNSDGAFQLTVKRQSA